MRRADAMLASLFGSVDNLGSNLVCAASYWKRSFFCSYWGNNWTFWKQHLKNLKERVELMGRNWSLCLEIKLDKWLKHDLQLFYLQNSTLNIQSTFSKVSACFQTFHKLTWLKVQPDSSAEQKLFPHSHTVLVSLVKTLKDRTSAAFI